MGQANRTHPQLWLGPHFRPFGLSPCSHAESSPWVCLLKPEFQHPAAVHTSRCMSLAGECSKVATTLCTDLSPFCLTQAGCCTLLRASDTPFLSGSSPSQWRVFPGWGNLSSFTAPSRGAGPILIPFFFSFVLPSYVVIFLAPLVVWDLLPVFSRYSMRIIPPAVVFLMYLCEEMSFTSFYSVILISTSLPPHFLISIMSHRKIVFHGTQFVKAERD